MVMSLHDGTQTRSARVAALSIKALQELALSTPELIEVLGENGRDDRFARTVMDAGKQFYFSVESISAGEC